MVQTLPMWCRLVLVGFSCSFLNAKLVNLSDAKAEVEAYYESGQYAQDVNKVVDKAICYFAKVPCPQEKTIIMDIDDTTLSTFSVAKAIHYGHIDEITLQAEEGASLPAVPGMKRLYDFLKRRGFHIIFLTGRTEKERESTERNLEDKGFTGFDQVILRNEQEKKLTAEQFKSNRRKQLAQEGYHIAGSIGDQWSDLLGGNAGHAVKLPNYLYKLV